MLPNRADRLTAALPSPVVCLCFVMLIGLSLASTLAAFEMVETPFVGVRRIEQFETSPRPLYINVMEIDLNAAGLSFQVTPRGPAPQPIYGGIPDETVIQTTRQFAEQVGAQVAINGAFFAAVHNSGGKLWTNNLGLTASSGDAYSPWESPFTANFDDALNITQDNQAAIVKMPASIPTGFETNPTVPLFNTLTGSHRLLNGGINVAPPPGGDSLTQINPRTAVGLTADNKLLLMTVDGRQTGFSEGVNLVELANLMADHGAVDAINLDGGGSTTMTINYFSDTDSYGNPFATRLANSPSGSERAVGSNLAVFAAPNPDFAPPQQAPVPPIGTAVLDSFESGEGRFSGSATASPDTSGVSSASQIVRVTNESHFGLAAQRLAVISSNPATPGWNLVHLSGGGVPSNNALLDSTGYVGFYAKVPASGIGAGSLQTSVLVDDGVELERGVPIDLVADGQWHLYQWDLADDSAWEPLTAGNGAIDQTQVTLHGLSFTSEENLDLPIFIDMVAHNPLGRLAPLPIAGDYTGDGMVDTADFQHWRNSFGMAVEAGTDADGNGNGIVDLADYTIWRDHLNATAAATAARPVPAPPGNLLALLGVLSASVWLRGFIGYETSRS